MIDHKFLFQKYIIGNKKLDGFTWDFPRNGMHIDHMEHFLDEYILKKGDLFIDIGANVGAWSLRASKFYTRVISFEPNQRVFRSLRKNIRKNGLKNVYPYQYAIDMRDDYTIQNIANPKVIGSPMIGDFAETVSLDSFMEKLRLTDRISMVKIDVEGAGLRVVKGGTRTILKAQPTLIVEVHSKDESLVPSILPSYNWKKLYRDMPFEGDWLYRENGKQVFLVGTPEVFSSVA